MLLITRQDWKLPLKKLVTKFGLKSGQKVMDVGTGTRVLIPFILDVIGPSGSVTAIDYAEEMVKTCLKKFSNFKQFKIKLLKIEDLNLDAESFDSITCLGTFPNLENKKKTLNEMNCVLKPGGKLVIVHVLGIRKLKDNHMKTSSVLANDVLLEKSAMICLLDEAGFVDIYIEDKPSCYLCTSIKKRDR